MHFTMMDHHNKIGHKKFSWLFYYNYGIVWANFDGSFHLCCEHEHNNPIFLQNTKA